MNLRPTADSKIVYRAFLSYAHADKHWGKWLHKRLESFKIEKDLVGRETTLGPVPKSLHPIFRDSEDFSGGHSLTDATIKALDQSAALIVLCSEVSATRPAVNEEVRLFRSRHPDRPVVPVILNGTYPENFPPALRVEIAADGSLTDREITILGPDLREDADGEDLSVAKVIAGLTGLPPDDIFKRVERTQHRAACVKTAVAATILGLAVVGGIAAWQWQQTRKTVVSYDTALERYCKDYLEKFQQQCKRNDLEGTFKLIATAAAEGKDPRNRKALDLIAEGKSTIAAPILRELAAEEAARGQAAIKRAAERYRTSGKIAFLSDTKAALADYKRAVELDPENFEGWNQLGWLQHRAGNLNDAIATYNHMQTVGENTKRRSWITIAKGNLGAIYITKKQWDKAENLVLISLVDNMEQGNEKGLSANYGNLGIIYKNRSELVEAEHSFRKGLKIDKRLNRKKGMASKYGGLAGIHYKRGELDKAEEMYLASLKIERELNRKWGIASDLSNLGNLYLKKGDLDKAEASYKESLSLSQAEGDTRRMANQNANLGNLEKQRGKRPEACSYWLTAKNLYEDLRKQKTAEKYEKKRQEFSC